VVLSEPTRFLNFTESSGKHDATFARSGICLVQARLVGSGHSSGKSGENDQDLVSAAFREPDSRTEGPFLVRTKRYCSFVFSAFACLRMGMSWSASFHSTRKS
jgi:hypothetical protein